MALYGEAAKVGLEMAKEDHPESDVQLIFEDSRYDALAVMLGNGQVSAFYRKMKEQNLSMHSFGSDVFSSREERVGSGEAAIGATYTGISYAPEFVARYVKTVDNPDQIGPAVNSYDSGSLLYALFSERSKKLTPEEILSRIESVKERDGVSGKYYFTRDDPEVDPVGGKRFKFPIVIKEVTEGGGERVLR